MSNDRYWIAINGASVAAHLLSPLKRPRVTPIPELLIGFSSAEEAAKAQQTLLTAPVQVMRNYLSHLLRRRDLMILQPHKPDPPTRGPTIWEEDDRVELEEGAVRQAAVKSWSAN